MSGPEKTLKFRIFVNVILHNENHHTGMPEFVVDTTTFIEIFEFITVVASV